MLLQKQLSEDPTFPDVFLLNNGMVVEFYNTEKQGCDELFRMELVLRVGSRNESPKEIGLSHLIEHLMASFTSIKYPDPVKNRTLISSYGIDCNAWTGSDNIGYYLFGLKKYQYLIIDMIINNFINPVYPDSLLEQEKEAVVVELSGYLNDTFYRLDKLFEFIIDNKRNSAFSLEYEINNVKNCTSEVFKNFRDKVYKPENVTLRLVSNFQKDEVNNILNSLVDLFFCKQINQVNPNNYYFKGSKVCTPRLNQSKLLRSFKYFFINHELNTDETKLVVYFPLSLSINDVRVVYPEFLSHLMTNGFDSRMYKKLRTELGVIYSIKTNFYVDSHDKKYSFFCFETSCGFKNAKKVIDGILDVLDFTLNNKITDIEYNSFIDQTKKNILLNNCSSSFSKYFNFYKDSFLWTNNNISLNEYHKCLLNIDKDLILRFSRRLFNPKKMKVFYSAKYPVLLPKFGDQKIPKHLEITMNDIYNNEKSLFNSIK